MCHGLRFTFSYKNCIQHAPAESGFSVVCTALCVPPRMFVVFRPPRSLPVFLSLPQWALVWETQVALQTVSLSDLGSVILIIITSNYWTWLCLWCFTSYLIDASQSFIRKIVFLFYKWGQSNSKVLSNFPRSWVSGVPMEWGAGLQPYHSQLLWGPRSRGIVSWTA